MCILAYYRTFNTLSILWTYYWVYKEQDCQQNAYYTYYWVGHGHTSQLEFRQLLRKISASVRGHCSRYMVIGPQHEQVLAEFSLRIQPDYVTTTRNTSMEAFFFLGGGEEIYSELEDIRPKQNAYALC